MIKVDNLTIGYYTDKIINNFSLEINKNDFVFIKGKNGSGKTTLLKAIAGILPYQKGKINYQISREKIFYMNQFFDLEQEIPLTCLEMLMMVDLKGSFFSFKTNNQRKKLALDSLEKMKLEGNTPIRNLSGGQKRRLYLSKAFLDDPDIFLLDEPFANLDDESIEILILILKEQKNKAIIIADHVLSLNEISNRISKKTKIINL